MLRAGFLVVAATFAVVTLVLIGQVIDATVRHVPGLFYLFAACDPPAILGAWLATMGAYRSPGETATKVRIPLLTASVALTVVGAVVLGDFILGRFAPGISLSAALSSKPAWLVADLATVLALGSLTMSAARVVRAPGAALSSSAIWGVGALLTARAIAGVWGALAPVPWPFRALEALLYAGVAWTSWLAASSCRGASLVRR